MCMYSVYSKSDDCNTIWDIIHDEDIKQKALEACQPVLARKLHSNKLQPLLQQQQLLTDVDSQVLLCDSRTHENKAEYLVNTLPRKQKGWFQSLLCCLEQSTIGTGHDLIYEALISKYEELRKSTTVDRASHQEVIVCTLIVIRHSTVELGSACPFQKPPNKYLRIT